MKKFPFPLFFFLSFVLLTFLPILSYAQSNQFCGTIVKATSLGDTAATFFDRFGNVYTANELDAFSYPKDVFLDCDSGIFTLEFGIVGNAPAWDMDEMNTICSVFKYVSGLVSSSTPSSGIIIRIIKDANCDSDAAGTPFWDSECGISNSVIFDQIVSGVSNYPTGFISGLICIRPNSNWHTLADDCSLTNPCVGSNDADLYTAILHEALHVVGFASRIGLTGAPLTGGFYSRWDKFLYSTNQNAYLIRPQNSTSCCDQHNFNTQNFPNMPTNLSGNCAMNVFFFDGTTNIAEVNIDNLTPTVSGQMANKLSHLDNTCTTGANFVMNPELMTGTSNRIVSTAEQSILCRLGYAGGNCSNSCAIAANNDGPYTLTLSQGTSMTITAAQLLANDAHPQTLTIGQCGNDPGITVSLNTTTNIFTVTGSQEGVFTFCYTVSGCQGWCDEGRVIVIVRQSVIPIDCQNPDCNLVCFGDFEDFLPQAFSYPSQINLPLFNFIGTENGASTYAELPSGSNIVAQIGVDVNNPDEYRGSIYLPLSDPIQSGCDITVEFDAVAYNANSMTNTPTIQVYGLTGNPCIDMAMLNSSIDPFTVCGNVTAYCLTNQYPGSTNFGIPLTFDPDIIYNSGAATILNLSMVHYTVTVNNFSGNDLQNIMFASNVANGMPSNMTRFLIFIDNIKVFSSCSSNIHLEVNPNPLPICIGGSATSTNVTVQITGDGSIPVTVNLQAGPLPPGLSFSGGSFNSNGQAQVTLTPNGPSQTLTLSLVAGPNWTPGTIIQVPIQASAATGSFCFNPNQDGAILEVVLQDCGTLFCSCPSPGYNVTGNTTLSASSLPQSGLNSTCLAIAGTLTIDNAIPNAIYTINASTINMQPGSSIVVDPGVTLNITGGTIQGCTKLWKSITVYGTLILKGVIVQDAEYAVRMKAGAKITLLGNTFKKNFTSVYYNETSGALPTITAFSSNTIHCENLSLLPSYPGQQSVSGTKSYAAVDLTFLKNGVNIGDGNNAHVNYFHHLQNGILINASGLTLKSTKFSDIPVNTEYAIKGYGIYSISSQLTQTGLGKNVNTPTFNNVEKGIWASQTWLDASLSTYTGTLTAIRAGNSNLRRVSVQNNLIYCDNIGIDLYQNQQANELICQSNDIYVDQETGDDLGKGIGIWVNDLTINNSNVVKGVSYNYVNTTGSDVGIRLNAATKYTIMGNTLAFANQSALTGISMAGSVDCIVSCNDVSGTGTGGSSNTNYTGNTSYSISQTTGTTYKCNTSANVRSGFLFSGFCGSSANLAPEFRGNTFGTINTAHRRGLWMTGTATFGAVGIVNEQLHKGNRWFGTYTGGTRAIHQGNPFLVGLSKFTVHTSSLPWYPQGLQANGAWFTTSSGTPQSCNSSECPDIMVREGDDIGDFGKRIAKDELDSLPGIYKSGLRWEMRRSLYRKIDDTPTIANNDTDVAAFYQENQGTALGKLVQVEKDLSAYTQIASNKVTEILSNCASIRAKLDTLAILESALPASPTTSQLSSVAVQKLAVSTRINTLNLTQNSLLDPLTQGVNASASTLVISNNAVSTTVVQEENRRKVNMIALNKVVKGMTNFTEIELGTLREVAAQCPITSGNAVYEARSILAYAGDIPAYDDDVLCDSAALVQARYLPQASNSQVAKGYLMTAVPNPANDYLIIAYSAPVDNAIMNVQLINTVGAIITNVQLAGWQGTQQMELSQLPVGLYYLRFVANGLVISVQKISIIH